MRDAKVDPGAIGVDRRRPLADARGSVTPPTRAEVPCHLVFPRAHTCIIGGADPRVRCRPPGRPFDGGKHLILRRKNGTRASRADQGSAPPLTRAPALRKLSDIGLSPLHHGAGTQTSKRSIFSAMRFSKPGPIADTFFRSGSGTLSAIRSARFNTPRCEIAAKLISSAMAHAV